MIYKILIIGAGSGLGGILRFLLILLVKNNPASVAWGTLTVNLIGCLAIGIFHGLADRHDLLSPDLRIFLTIGLCGGFTTYSSFANELFSYLKTGQIHLFALYAALSGLGGLLAVGAGYCLSK